MLYYYYEPVKKTQLNIHLTYGESNINILCRGNKISCLLGGNSIGGVIALKAAEILKDNCKGIILIDCAQRTMDDKRLKKMIFNESTETRP